jgi:hypothetical protein
MAVIYRGDLPDKNYSIMDFYQNGVVVSWMAKFRHHETKKIKIRCIFRSNGLLGEIRSCGDTFAIDIQWGWGSDTQRCLTTECKTLREAKSILFIWFKSKGFSLPKKETDNDWRKNHLAYNNQQLNLNPFVFRI